MIAAGWRFSIADVTGLHCMEIDTPEDLAAAQRLADRMAQSTRTGSSPDPSAGNPPA
jgi:choline kinase